MCWRVAARRRIRATALMTPMTPITPARTPQTIPGGGSRSSERGLRVVRSPVCIGATRSTKIGPMSHFGCSMAGHEYRRATIDRVETTASDMFHS